MWRSVAARNASARPLCATDAALQSGTGRARGSPLMARVALRQLCAKLDIREDGGSHERVRVSPIYRARHPTRGERCGRQAEP